VGKGTDKTVKLQVLLDRVPSEDQMRRWQQGVELDDAVSITPTEIWLKPGSRWLRVVVREGRKRQIRETAQVLGLEVQRLIRVRLASLLLGDLASGDWRDLTKSEIMNLVSGLKGT
jgi:23S rRNA pseudouridine2605 synthase